MAPSQNQTKDKGKGKAREKRRASEDVGEDADSEEATSSVAAKPAAVKKLLSQHKVRTSQQDRTLDSMFPVTSPSQVPDNNTTAGPLKPPDIPVSEVYLQSVDQLRAEVELGRHQGTSNNPCLGLSWSLIAQQSLLRSSSNIRSWAW